MISNASNHGRGKVEGSISGLTTRELAHPVTVRSTIIVIEFELHKRSEAWDAFDKLIVIRGDREFEQGRAILFNVVIEANVGI